MLIFLMADFGCITKYSCPLQIDNHSMSIDPTPLFQRGRRLWNAMLRQNNPTKLNLIKTTQHNQLFWGRPAASLLAGINSDASTSKKEPPNKSLLSM
jgi:hypothetical protein